MRISDCVRDYCPDPKCFRSSYVPSKEKRRLEKSAPKAENKWRCRKHSVVRWKPSSWLACECGEHSIKPYKAVDGNLWSYCNTQRRAFKVDMWSTVEVKFRHALDKDDQNGYMRHKTVVYTWKAFAIQELLKEGDMKKSSDWLKDANEPEVQLFLTVADDTLPKQEFKSLVKKLKKFVRVK